MVFRKTKVGKMDIAFYKAIQEISLKRVLAGKDRRPSPPTIQRKMLKHPLWKDIKKDLEIADFIRDNEAQLDYFRFTPFILFRMIVVLFATVIIFAGLIWGVGLLNTTFHQIGLQNEVNSGKAGYTNLTLASDNTFGKFNSSIQALRLVAITVIFSEILALFVLASFQRVHPFMFIVWILITFLAVMFSAPIANSYEALLNQDIFDGTLGTFSGANYFFLHLPIFTLLIGIFGGIFMFINIFRGGQQESL